MSSAFIARWLFYAVLVALPFGTRKFLFQFTPGFHEYETAFIYGTDVLLAIFFAAACVAKVKSKNEKVKTTSKNSKRTYVFFATFILLAGISIFFAASKGLAAYAFVRLLTAAGFAAAVAYVIRSDIVPVRGIFATLAGSAVIQSLIAFAQFVKQGSVGLWFLGEPVLSAHAPGIAKFAAEGGKILRAYGTFPHPNILGAFFVLGLISLAYLWLRGVLGIGTGSQKPDNQKPGWPLALTPKTFTLIVAPGSFFVVLLGLILTFSRSAWLIAIISSSALMLYCFTRRELRRRALLFFFVLCATSYSLFATLKPFIFPRAQISATEPSVTQRLEYNRLGVELISTHPLGVGVGNQVLYAVRNGLYEKFGMTKAWQWEPIHNIYLFMASEIGIAGLVSFTLLIFLFLNPKSKILNSKQIQNLQTEGSNKGGFLSFDHLNLFRISSLEFSVSAIMLVALLLFGLVDHFLWTLRPGQLMLWLAIGLVWGLAGRGEYAAVQ